MTRIEIEVVVQPSPRAGDDALVALPANAAEVYGHSLLAVLHQEVRRCLLLTTKQRSWLAVMADAPPGSSGSVDCNGDGNAHLLGGRANHGGQDEHNRRVRIETKRRHPDR